MSFRDRLTLVAAAAVAVAVALASVGVYVAARNVLRGQIDDTLTERLERASSLPVPEGPGGVPRVDRLVVVTPEEQFGGTRMFVQLIGAEASQRNPARAGVGLPVSGRARQVAAGSREAYFQDVRVRGAHLRLLTAPFDRGFAVQIARPLDEVDRTLRRLAVILVGFTLAGVALAALLGRGVARAALAPVRSLSAATEHVAATKDLSRRIEPGGRDELGRLAASFNEMLAALERSLSAQRQLVADASHELRTPLTSLRTNIEVLATADALTGEERRRLLAEIVEQLEELTALVSDVVELARDGEPEHELQDVRLDRLVEDAVARARRHAPEVRFETNLEPSVVRGVPHRLARAVGNLLDNAAKWSPAGGIVDVCVHGGKVCVRDRGPGIAEEHLPHVFDRFYRAPSARGRPGSGLGLAIVRQVAEAHGGRVEAEPAAGGGTRVRLHLLPNS
jgi:two-component system, OmpR family, sensor histidine kinase MprB